MFVVFLQGCEPHTNHEKKTYYYNAFSENNNVVAYYKRVCVFKESIFRVDSIFRYNLKGNLTETLL